MKYKCVLAEDVALDRDILEMLLGKMDNLEVVASCSDGFQAAQILMKQEVDIVFSDIDMPKVSGLSLLRSLKNPPVFIFISSYKQYAAESFELDVVDFIVKPIMPHRLLKAVNKAIEHIETKRIQVLQYKATIIPIDETFLLVRTADGLVKLLVEDVAYIESHGNISKIFMVDCRVHTILLSLTNLEKQLPMGFFIWVHKQYIVNKHNIIVVDIEGLTVAGPYDLPLSPLYHQNVMDAILENKVLEGQSKIGTIK